MRGHLARLSQAGDESFTGTTYRETIRSTKMLGFPTKLKNSRIQGQLREGDITRHSRVCLEEIRVHFIWAHPCDVWLHTDSHAWQCTCVKTYLDMRVHMCI